MQHLVLTFKHTGIKFNIKAAKNDIPKKQARSMLGVGGC